MSPGRRFRSFPSPPQPEQPPSHLCQLGSKNQISETFNPGSAEAFAPLGDDGDENQLPSAVEQELMLGSAVGQRSKVKGVGLLKIPTEESIADIYHQQIFMTRR